MYDVLLVVPSLDDGITYLESYNDDGKNAMCEWQRISGGDSWRKRYGCSMHLHCAVEVRVVATADGSVHVERKRGTIHSTELKDFDRTNAKLTKEQKKRLREGVSWGGYPKNVMIRSAKDNPTAAEGKRSCIRTHSGLIDEHRTAFVACCIRMHSCCVAEKHSSACTRIHTAFVACCICMHSCCVASPHSSACTHIPPPSCRSTFTCIHAYSPVRIHSAFISIHTAFHRPVR